MIENTNENQTINNPVSTPPMLIPPKKWYKNKAVIAIAILAVIAFGVSYIALKQSNSNSLLRQLTPGKKVKLESLQSAKLKLLAQKTTVIQPGITFAIPGLPNIEFKILQVTKASGPTKNSECNGGDSIYMEYSSPITINLGSTTQTQKELCNDGGFEISKINDQLVEHFNTENSNVGVRMNKVKGAIVAVDLAVANNSNNNLNSQFLHLAYTAEIYKNNDFDNTSPIQLIAESYPDWGNYEVPAQTGKVIRVGFLIRENTDEVELLYGNFGNIEQQYAGVNPFKLALGSIKVNFTTKVFSKTDSNNNVSGSNKDVQDQVEVNVRDEQRQQDIDKISKALGDYSFKNSFQFPPTLDQLLPTFIPTIPKAPTPQDGSCTASQNQYSYQLVDEKHFILKFCISKSNDKYEAGVNLVGAGGTIQIQTITKQTAGEKVNLGLAQLSDGGNGSISIQVRVQEEDFAKFKVGQTVTLMIPEGFGISKDQKYTATVKTAEHLPTVITGSTIPQITLTIAKNPQFQPGGAIFLDAIMSDKSNVLAVPKQAVIEKGGKKYVRVITDPIEKTFKEVEVTTGFVGTETIEITSGLKEGQEIISFL